MKYLLTILFFLSFSSTSISNEKSRGKIEKLRFDNLEKAIKDDKLKKIIKNERKKIKLSYKTKKKNFKNLYNFPTEGEFWNFFSDYWLIKNEPILKWNYQRTDYKLIDFVKKFFKDQGVLDKSISVLLLNTPVMFYGIMPTKNNKLIFLLSNPFIKILDLSKEEISLLFFQEYIRNKEGILFKYLKSDLLANKFSSNFYKKNFSISFIEPVQKAFNDLYLYKGFNFQDQYNLTKALNIHLQSNLKLWGTYINLLKKIDSLTKSNSLYKDYIKKFPSPELQINWLTDKFKKNSNF